MCVGDRKQHAEPHLGNLDDAAADNNAKAEAFRQGMTQTFTMRNIKVLNKNYVAVLADQRNGWLPQPPWYEVAGDGGNLVGAVSVEPVLWAVSRQVRYSQRSGNPCLSGFRAGIARRD